MKGWALPPLGVWIWAYWARQWAHWAYQVLFHILPSSHAVVVLLHMDTLDLEPHVADLKKAYSSHYCIYLLLSFLGPGCCLFLMSVS